MARRLDSFFVVLENQATYGEGEKPMDEATIRLEARLGAIENVLAGLCAKVHLMMGRSAEDFARDAQALRQTLQRFAVPGVEPTLSDLVSAELEAAHTKLLQKIADSFP